MSIKTMTFCGRSTSEFAGVTVASADYGSIESKRNDDELPLRDGLINGSRENGRQHYKARTITYILNLVSTPAALEALISSVRAWLTSGCGDLTDGYNTGWKFTNADYLSSDVDFVDMHLGAARLTVRFTADPYMQSVTGSRQRLTAWAAQGSTARAVIDNAAVYPLTWLEVPSTPASNVLTFPINATAEQQSQRNFYIFGIPDGVTVSDVYVVRQSSTITGEVTMTAPDRGTLGSVQEDDMVVLTYSDDITAAVAVGGVSSGTSYSVTNPVYRLKALTDGTPTLKINGVSQIITQAFTLPDTALLAINANVNRYGYYELWHDDTEVRL
ncbi:MAG: hypothetical protein UHG68_01320 [Clostridia bacterium]|nr:hypothetical protein [Clostridia bacterium]